MPSVNVGNSITSTNLGYNFSPTSQHIALGTNNYLNSAKDFAIGFSCPY